MLKVRRVAGVVSPPCPGPMPQGASYVCYDHEPGSYVRKNHNTRRYEHPLAGGPGQSGWGYGPLGKFSSGSLNPQRLASSDESGIVAPAPQSAQFRLTFSTCGGAIIGQKASSMTKVLELQRWQANSFFSCITCPRQRFRSSETNMSGGYHAIHPTSGNTCSRKFT